jgi:ribose transport system substrate-binding protein
VKTRTNMWVPERPMTGQRSATRPARRRLWLVPLATAVAVAIAACSSASSSSTTQQASSSPPASQANPVTSGSGVSAARVTQAALAAAKAAGPVTKVPTETIGYLRYIAADESDQRIYNAFVAAAHVLGWKVISCDGQGNPTVMVQCMNTLLADHPAAIVNDGIPQSLIATGLQQAKSEGIPTVYTGGSLTPANLYTAGYVPPDAAMGQMLSGYIVKQLSKLSGTQDVIAQTFAAPWGAARVNAFTSAVKGTNVKIVAQPAADATNLVQGTQTQISALLTQYPNAKAVWVTFDGAVSGAAQAVASKYPGQSFPQAPMVATFYDELQTLQLIRQGTVTVTVAEPLEWCSWVAVDQLAEYFARKTPLSQSVRPDYGAGMTFWQPTLITKANLPPQGQLVTPPVNFVPFFTTKWHAEFAVG